MYDKNYINTYLKGKKQMKKIFAILLAAMLAVTLIACSKEESKPEENNLAEETAVYEDINLSNVADSLYEGIDPDNMPFVSSREVGEEEFEFVTFIKYEKELNAVVNEPTVGAIAHSVVLVECPTAEKANEVAKAMEENCNPRKWVCVEADVVKTATNKNIAMLLMTTEDGGLADTIVKNFESLDDAKVKKLLEEKAQDVVVDDVIIEEDFGEDFENFEDFEVFTPEDEDVVLELPESEAGDEPAAMPGDMDRPVVDEMPAVDTPVVDTPVIETPEAESPADETTIEDLYMLADQLYEGIDPENMPFVGTMELTEENFEYSAFVPYKSSYLAVENLPMMGSQPHSVVIVKADSAKEAAALAEEMKNNANPRTWICVQAKSVKSASKGNMAILVMTSVDVMPDYETIDEEKAEEMSLAQSEERAQIIIDNFLANA